MCKMLEGSLNLGGAKEGKRGKEELFECEGRKGGIGGLWVCFEREL